MSKKEFKKITSHAVEMAYLLLLQFIGGIVAICLVLLGFWIIVHFYAFLSSNSKKVELSQPTAYEVCANEVRIILDNINDTPGASYGHEDAPSKEIKELIDHCMENNK
jgi:hypothetical protein